MRRIIGIMVLAALFIWSEIDKQKQITSEINKQTEEIRQEILRRDSTRLELLII